MNSGGGNYSYSPVHRAVEVTSIVLFAVFVVLLGGACVRALMGPYGAHAYWLVPTALIVGYLIADFVSGVVHWLADNFGHENLPVVGPALIRPFREHHVDPRAITRHDFIETNGNNCLVCWPWLVTYYFVLPPDGSIWALLFISTWLVFNVGILGTNQFHKWSHLEHPPAWIVKLQEWRLILSPDHHDIHHTAPFQKYYCITTGWLNPLLCDYLKFFQRAEALIRWVLRAPKPTTAPVAAPAPIESGPV